LILDYYELSPKSRLADYFAKSIKDIMLCISSLMKLLGGSIG